MIHAVLFPSSYQGLNKVDEDLQKEYDAVRNTGLYDVILFGYEKWFCDGKLVLNHVPDEMITAVYRGWMMRPERYEAFYGKLLEKNIRLTTTPEEYRQFHVFPNVYPLIAESTARTMIFPEGTPVDLEAVKARFKRFMVKDYVKSVKGTNFPVYFENTVSQDEFDQWMSVFYKYRGELFTGGICVKEFLELKKYHSKTNEYRVFYINHEPATISRNSGQIPLTEAPPRGLIEAYSRLPGKFYTVDYAELEDGSWKIIEAGDGSVSGLSENQDYEAFFRALYQCFK